MFVSPDLTHLSIHLPVGQYQCHTLTQSQNTSELGPRENSAPTPSQSKWHRSTVNVEIFAQLSTYFHTGSWMREKKESGLTSVNVTHSLSVTL